LDRVRDSIEIPLYEPWQIAVIVLLCLLALGLILWGITRFIRARNQRTHHEPPHKIALAELKAAAELTKDDDERFAVLSSLALRRYFETGKGIPALERTSLEFLEAMEGHPQMSADARASLSEFLEHCDRVKFAQASLTQTERNALTESATALIHQFEQATVETPAKEVPAR
jgi:hypothetical protein